MFQNIHVNTCMYITTINEKEAMYLQERKEWYMGGLGRRKGNA